jgi:hypothetical protein
MYRFTVAVAQRLLCHVDAPYKMVAQALWFFFSFRPFSNEIQPKDVDMISTNTYRIPQFYHLVL